MKISSVNFLLGVLGLTIIWLSTHSGVAILGGIVAAIHITVNGKSV